MPMDTPVRRAAHTVLNTLRNTPQRPGEREERKGEAKGRRSTRYVTRPRTTSLPVVRVALMTTWLITGGAGYIGAHVARAMAEAGERVVVFDDLSTGIPERLPREIPLVKGSTLTARRLMQRSRSTA